MKRVSLERTASEAPLALPAQMVSVVCLVAMVTSALLAYLVQKVAAAKTGRKVPMATQDRLVKLVSLAHPVPTVPLDLSVSLVHLVFPDQPALLATTRQ